MSLLHPPQTMPLFQQISQRKCPTPYPEDNPQGEHEINQGQVTFNMQRKWYEFVDSPGNETNLLYVIYHENHNKCYLFYDTSELSQYPFYIFI